MPVTEPAYHQLAIPLPVSSAEALLKCLAESWQRSTGAKACLVSLIANRKLSCAFIDSDRIECPQFSSIQLDEPTTEWSATLVSESLISSFEGKPGQLTSVTVVSFEFAGKCSGGVLLLGDFEDSRELTVLAAISGQLVEQLRSILESTSAAQLRDLKLEAMAEFAAGAGHEINNPVATIAGRSALLLKTETDPERRRLLETIGGQAYRIRDMIGDAMTFARPPEPVLEEINAATEILQIRHSLEKQFSHRRATVEALLDESIRLSADREQFRVVVSCLIKNSLEAIEDGGLIRLELSSTSTTSENSQRPFRRVCFAVSDNGIGLSETQREHLFDPFYSGRQAGRGLGFGLSKCWQILRVHGGSIEASEALAGSENTNRGLTIITFWPC